MVLTSSLSVVLGYMGYNTWLKGVKVYKQEQAAAIAASAAHTPGAQPLTAVVEADKPAEPKQEESSQMQQVLLGV